MRSSDGLPFRTCERSIRADAIGWHDGHGTWLSSADRCAGEVRPSQGSSSHIPHILLMPRSRSFR